MSFVFNVYVNLKASYILIMSFNALARVAIPTYDPLVAKGAYCNYQYSCPNQNTCNPAIFPSKKGFKASWVIFVGPFCTLILKKEWDFQNDLENLIAV